MHDEKNMQDVKERHASNRKRAVLALVMAALGTLMFSMPALAATDTTVTASNTMIKLISLMCSMFKYVGVAIVVWALIQFILATKRSDADSKADAIQTAVCGIALMSIAAVVKAIGIGDAINSSGGNITDDTLDAFTGTGE